MSRAVNGAASASASGAAAAPTAGRSRADDGGKEELDDEEDEDVEEDDRQLLSSGGTSHRRPPFRSLLELGSRSRRLLTQSRFDARYGFTRPKALPSSLLGRLRTATTAWPPSRRCLVQWLLGLLPCIGAMRQYRWRDDLPSDVIAGLTVGVMNIPQGMAYAMLAELPPVCGLYLGFFPLILYFFFGTSRQVSVGTFALSSLMVAVPVARLVGGDGVSPAVASILGNATLTLPGDAASGDLGNSTATADAWLDYYRVQVALSVTLLAGLVQIALGLLQFGFITIYLSTPLVSGFTTGAAFHVATSQVPALFGVSVPRHVGAFKLARAYADIASQLGHTNLATLAISAICIGLLLLFRLFVNAQLAKRCRLPVPIELCLVVAGTAGSYFGQLRARCGVDIVGDIPSGLQPPRMPSVRLFQLVWQDSVLLAVVMYVCTFSICKLYANKHGYGLDANQELLAGGVVNSVGPLFGCYFAAGSLSRSQVQDDMGGRSQVASLVSAGLMVFVLLFLGPLFRELPTAVLACIIIVALKGLFLQFADAKRLYAVSGYDFSIWMVCFLGVVVLNVSYGLMLGFAYSLLTVVCRTQSPSASLLGRLPTTDIYKDVRFYPSAVQVPGVAIFRFDGALYFASVDNFRYRLARLSGLDPKRPADPGVNDANGDRPHHIVVDCSGVNYADSVGADFLRSLLADYRRQHGVTVLFAGCKHQFRRTWERTGFADKRAVFVSVHDAVLAALAGQPAERERVARDARRSESASVLLSWPDGDDGDGEVNSCDGESTETALMAEPPPRRCQDDSAAVVANGDDGRRAGGAPVDAASEEDV